ncbi:hypothetical protein [uncultured Litoreibacter sp.]|uniref:hypothetical protein n=1 Tax=uncultured Litoreibacter sp. TaxID=1392394 RepID=UPI0026070998|nr:hypothetical protein [uncultured Litoreibacter sp.]
MGSEPKSQAYSERYATWRHLDGIRYQIIQLSIAFIGAVVILTDIGDGSFPPWMYFLIGLVYLALWGVLAKVNSAIRGNGAALREFGKTIGDDKLPDVSQKERSVFFYIELGYFLLGATFLLAAILSTFGTIEI